MTDPTPGADPDPGPGAGPGAGSDATPRHTPRPTPRPTPARRPGRGRWVLVLLVLSGVVALTALPVWVTATGASPVVGDVALTVGGAAAAPGLVPAALVLLAAAGALALVGRAGSWVVAGVVAGSGALVVASALTARSGAGAAAERAAAETTGVSSLTDGPHVAAWPWVAAALGVLVVVAAVGLARASGGWSAPSDRHERAATGASPVPPAGASATAPATPAVPAPAAAPGPAGADVPGPAGPVDERSTWDALSRGDDPT